MARPARLSRGQIVATALELVDDSGTDALTMRALARRLDVDPMAIYRHVADKDDLLGAMCDVAVTALPELDPKAPWEPQVRALALELHTIVVRRPALLPVLASAPVTPVSLAVTQQAIALLVAAGASEEAATSGFAAIFSYVIGAAMVAIADPPAAKDQAGLLAEGRALLDDSDPQHLVAAAGLLQGSDDLERGLDVVLAGVRDRLAA